MTARLKLQAMLILLHQPLLVNEPGMVCQVWEDGEITLQKSGELYEQRNLHMIVEGIPSLAREPMELPMKMYGTHSCVCLASMDRAETLIREYVMERTGMPCEYASIAKYIDKEFDNAKT